MPAQPQTLQNHTASDPVHGPAIILLFLNVLVALVWAFRAHTPGLPLRMWIVLVSAALLVSSLKARTNPQRVQDRIIRLEERLRLATLLPREELLQVLPLTTAQLIGLRFASDGELPALALRAARENLSQAAIKEAVQVWRPDNARV